MRRAIRIRQHDKSDCGPACLASVATYYRLQLPIARIRQYAGTDDRGTNVLGLLEAAEKLGFDIKAVRGNQRCVRNIPLPAIVHMGATQNTNHFVVLYKATKNFLVIMDPCDGQLHRKPRQQFLQEWTGILLLLIPGARFEKGNYKISVSNRLWVLLKPHKSILFQAFIGAIVSTLLGFSTSLYLQKLTDYVFTGGNTNLLNLLSIGMLILLIMQTIIGAFKDVFLIRTGQLIDLRLILGYHKHLLKLPQKFFDTMQIGEILSRISDAVKIRKFINTLVLNLTVNLLILIFSFALMFAIYWRLALIMLGIIPIYISIYMVLNTLNKRTERKVMEAAARLESQLVESLRTVRTVKLFGLDSYLNLQTEKRFVTLLRQVYTSGLNGVFSGYGTSFVSGLFTIILLWMGSLFVIRKEITPGELLSFYAILAYFTGPVSRLINANKDIQSAFIAADRLFEVMDLERENAEGLKDITGLEFGDIEFKNVHFRYGHGSEVFKDLCLRIPKGKITAIVGESGSGKSSLVNLVQKLYPYQGGRISIGGTNLDYLSTTVIRSVIAVVPQEIHLYHGTVIENIAVGEYEPNLQEVLRITSLLGLSTFIENLPNGFKSPIGENGALLSGGQKQRLAIARALYKKPEVLILDEATSCLDSRSEHFILNALKQMSNSGKTVVLIAHRLSTVVDSHKIILLDSGTVIEEGTHQKLLAAKSAYYAFWKNQVCLSYN